MYANRRRIQGERGQRLLRTRGELLERPNAHLYDTGGMRRTHLRGHANILKRLLVHASACNLGLWMRTMCGVGTRRGLQDGLAALTALVLTFWWHAGHLRPHLIASVGRQFDLARISFVAPLPCAIATAD